MTARDLRHFEREKAGTRIDLLADPALGDEDAAQVIECLLGRKPSRHLLDGDRSIVFPAQGETSLGGLKIKGAGFRGGPVRMGRRHDKPYPLPRYDAEGAATLDAAKDHGRANAGGMSYQQARHEFTVSRLLHDRGLKVFPALGYGSLRRDGDTSWFCLLDWPGGQVQDWFRLIRAGEHVERIATAFGETQREFAQNDVYLLLSGLVDYRGTLLRKDFHTAHIAGPNDSFLTLLSYYLFDTNFILAQLVHDYRPTDRADHRNLARTAYIRALTGEEHGATRIEAFKRLLVELKYADWEMQRRIDRLAADPIGRSLLEGFLERGGERALLGTLPAVSEFPSGGEPPEPAAAPRRRFPWFGRTR